MPTIANVTHKYFRLLNEMEIIRIYKDNSIPNNPLLYSLFSGFLMTKNECKDMSIIKTIYNIRNNLFSLILRIPNSIICFKDISCITVLIKNAIIDKASKTAKTTSKVYIINCLFIHQ